MANQLMYMVTLDQPLRAADATAKRLGAKIARPGDETSKGPNNVPSDALNNNQNGSHHQDTDSSPCLIVIQNLSDLKRYPALGPQATNGFDVREYLSFLRTKRLGRKILFTDVTTTTMELTDAVDVSDRSGFVVVANEQIQGKGRGQNPWTSPRGCATFTFNFDVSLDSGLAGHLGFLQHIIPLATLRAVFDLVPPSLPLPLAIKWPNDIYCIRPNGDRLKIGGLLFKTLVMGRKAHCVVGLGVNVNNSNPTICINDLIEEANSAAGSSTEKGVRITIPRLIAQTLNQVEWILEHCERKGDSGVETIKSEYKRYWLHQNQVVHVHNHSEQFIVTDLDSNGFLVVKSAAGDKELTLQPDSNSFDMMQNLITIKG